MRSLGLVTYWQWFFCRGGYRRIINVWLAGHGVLGVTLGYWLDMSIKDSAATTLLPLAAILVGLCFAWAGNAQALMQTAEMRRLSDYHPGGFQEYVYTYQTAILVVLVTIVGWGLGGLGAYDVLRRLFISVSPDRYAFIVRSVLFTLSSLTVRECWHVVMGVGLMLSVQKELKQSAEKKQKRSL